MVNYFVMASSVKVQLRQVSASATEVTMGKHQVLIDRPAAKGGTDLGPMGGELFLAAAGGCFMSNLLAAIKARGADVSGVQTEVIGTLAESPARFTVLQLRVTADNADRELLEKLVEIAKRACIIMNTLRGTLELTIRTAAPV